VLKLKASARYLCFCTVCSTYVVVAPQIVRPGSTYGVIVTILRARSSVDVVVKLLNSHNDTIVSNRVTITTTGRATHNSAATGEKKLVDLLFGLQTSFRLEKYIGLVPTYSAAIHLRVENCHTCYFCSKERSARF